MIVGAHAQEVSRRLPSATVGALVRRGLADRMQVGLRGVEAGEQLEPQTAVGGRGLGDLQRLDDVCSFWSPQKVSEAVGPRIRELSGAVEHRRLDNLLHRRLGVHPQ